MTGGYKKALGLKRPMDVLVTGSSGFVGTNLCRRLADEGHNVVGVDIEAPRYSLDSVRTHEYDLRSRTDLPHADVIIHLAAHSQVQRVVDKPGRALENIEMTQNVLKHASDVGAAVVNASSRDVYGSEIRPSEEEVTPESPNGYAASKLSSEAIANAFRKTRNVPVTSVRLANVYGRMDTNRRVIPIFIALAYAGEELSVYGQGKLLDFVHIDDVCDAFLSTIQRMTVMDGEAVNIGSGTGTVLTDVAEYIAECIDDCPGWSVSGDRSGDVGQYVSDISKAKAMLGYEADVPLDEGLKTTIDWYLNHPELLEDIRSRLAE